MERELKWLLRFQPQKCKFIKFGKMDVSTEYKLGERTLERAPEEKDIGVYMDSDLSVSTNIGL